MDLVPTSLSHTETRLLTPTPYRKGLPALTVIIPSRHSETNDVPESSYRKDTNVLIDRKVSTPTPWGSVTGSRGQDTETEEILTRDFGDQSFVSPMSSTRSPETYRWIQDVTVFFTFPGS